MGVIRMILVALTRLVGLGFVVVAGLSIPEALAMLNESYTLDGSTLYVPLLICEPRSIELNGSAVEFDAEDVGKCHNQSFLVQAVVMSLAFGMGAMVIFFFFDLLASKKIGPFGKSSVLGMGLFLIFILVQSALCTWALARESLYWTQHFTDLYQEGYNATVASPVDSVKTYGSYSLLFAAGGSAILASIFLLVESIVKVCWKDGDSNDDSSVFMKNGAPASPKSKLPRSSTASTKVKASEQMDDTSLSLSEIDPPLVEEGYGSSPPPAHLSTSSGNFSNPDKPSWLSGDNY